MLYPPIRQSLIGSNFIFLKWAALTALVFATNKSSAQASWSSAANGNWNTPSSWSTGVVPGVGTNATISVAGTYTVTYDSAMAAASIASLTLGSSTVTLNISASGFNVAGTTTFVDSSVETINLNAGGVMNNGTLAMSSRAGLMNVNSGAFLTNNVTKVADNSSNDGSTRLKINPGAVCSLGTVTVGRSVQGNNTYGLYISGGTVSATSIDVGSRNSYANMTVAGGTLTNSGNLRLGTGTPTAGREMTYYQSGGTVNCAGTLDMSVSANATTWFSITSSGSVFSASGIRLFPNAVSSPVARFTNGGTIYLGSSGFKTLNSGSYTACLNDASVLGANADWAGNVNFTTVSGTVTFKCADASNIAHDIILTNPITGGASLAKTGSGTFTLLGASTYSGSTTVAAGTLQYANNNAIPATSALTIGSGGNSATLDLAGFSPQIFGLATAGTATSQLITNSSPATTSSLIFSNSSTTSTFGGIVAGGTRPINLVNLGGNLNLSDQNNYAGNIFINNGRLSLSGSGSTFTGASIVLSNSAATLDLTGMNTLSLAAGQTLSGFGTVTGNVSAANCAITPGANGTGGTLKIVGTLSLNGNVTNQFDLLLDPNALGSDLIAVNGPLNLSGVNVIKLNPLAGSLLEGTYHLYTCSSVSGDTNNLMLVGSPGAGLEAYLDVTGSGIDLVVTQMGGGERVWVGDGSANQWDLVATNWLNAGLPSPFANGNSVIFDDTSTNSLVAIVGALHPIAITVDSTTNYTFTGSGKITGAITFIKTNSSTLTLLTTNDYTGVTSIDRGILQVGNGVASGALGQGSLINNSLLLMQQPANGALSNNISGSGVLVQAGTGTLTLNGSNTFSGGTLISSGALQIGQGGSLGTGSITNNSSIVFNNSSSNAVNNAISGSGSLTLSGSGTVLLSGPNTYTGSTLVNNGTLLVNGTNLSSLVTVSSLGKLGGKGTIAKSVIINSGAILAPGTSPGTLTILSNLTVNSGAVLNFELGTTSDKVVVGGNLSLSGTLNITDAGGLGNGTYTLFAYSGSVVVSGLNIGTAPSGKLYQIDTTTPGQVNLIVGVIATNVPAFPGALGFGAIATGGRGGPIYHVTTLADSGTGSFRDAVSVGGRTIVFDVGGYITLNTAVSAQGNLTIAGQTAPGGGIGFKGGEISFAGRGNIIMRHIRIRPGSDTASSTDDALSLYQSKNVILDHCSFEFAPWNNIDGVGDSSHVITNITFQNCIIADPTGQQFGCHSESVGGTWSWFYNVFANSHNRNPLAKVNTVFINNVLYNCSAGYTTHTSTSFKHDIVNNYFIAGPAASSGFPWFQIDNNQSMYFTGNLYDSDKNGTLGGSTTVPLPGYQGGGTILASPWSSVTTSVPIYSPASGYRLSVSRAGTLPLDEMDNLIMSQVKTLGSGTTGYGAGTVGPNGSLYTSQAQTGLANNGYGSISGGVAPLDNDNDAMPDYWETAVGLNPYNPLDATNLVLSGYTQLEVYLNWLAEPHAVVQINTNMDINLAQYCAGFTNVGPTYSISNVVNGTVTLLPDGRTARYVPPTNFTGRASFLFKVTGNDGSSMTNTMGLVVTGVAPAQDLTWRGDGIANNWDIATTTNWLNAGSPDVFHAGDNVTFNDIGSNSPNINLTGTIVASSVTVNGTKNYSFSGVGALTGAGTLTKSGTSTLTLATTNSGYSGNVFLNGGTLALASGSSLGSATVNLANSSIFNLLSGTALFFGGTVYVQAGQVGYLASGQLANGFSGPITCGNASSTLNLSGGVSFSGTTSSQFDGFLGTVNIPSGSSLRFSSNSSGNTYGSLNPTFIINGTLQPRNAGNTIQLGQLSGSGAITGPQSNGGTGDTLYVVGGNNLDASFSGNISSNSQVAASSVLLTKTGSGKLTLSGLSTFTGNTTLSGGTLIVNGTNISSATTVASGTTLGGNGQIGGLVTVNTGGKLAPGVNTGTFSLTGGLTLNSANLYFDLANTTAPGNGVNDLINLGGSSLNLSGTSTIYPNFLNGGLANGTYTLISGGSSTTGSAANLAWGGTGGTRQNFTFDLSTPGTVLLQVSGSPSTSLIWRGTNGNSWDTSTTNWSNSGAPDKFYNGDAVEFDDSAAGGNVVLSGTLMPGSMIVSNNSLAYAFSGGTIAGATSLQKLGSSSATLFNSNSFTGGTIIAGGDITLANDIANQSGFGTGLVTLLGGTINMYSSIAVTNTIPWNLSVPAASTGSLNADSACSLYGSLTGGGTLNLSIPAKQTTFYGDWSAFSGQLNISSPGNGDFRLANPGGLPNAVVNMAPNTSLYYAIDPGADTVVAIGSLSGDSTTRLAGAIGESTLTFRLGGLNSDASFYGQISEQDTNTTTAIEKVGSGTWSLSGSNSYVGDTLVSAGTLLINNSTGSGTGVGNSLFVDNNATLGGSGVIGSDTAIFNGGTLAPGNPVGTLTISNNLTLNDGSLLKFSVGTVTDKVSVSGNLALTGQLYVTNGSGFGPGSYTLFTCAGAITVGNLTVVSTPAGYSYNIDTSTPGTVKLVVSLPSAPVITNPGIVGGNLVFTGSGGTPNGTYYVLSSTNLSIPLLNWNVVQTNHFDSNGNFSVTNGPATNSQTYFQIKF